MYYGLFLSKNDNNDPFKIIEDEKDVCEKKLKLQFYNLCKIIYIFQIIKEIVTN